MAINIQNYPPSYSFRINKVDGWKVNVKRKGENPKFNISNELRTAVYENFPHDATVEEKAIFIYYKLCQLMNYDNNYMYDLKFNGLKNYSSEFDRAKYECMKPGDLIVCWDFARLYERFVNELGEDIEGVTYSYGSKTTSHWECGFYTDKVSVLLNPVEPRGNDAITDLARLKLGVWPQAISPDSSMTQENIEFLTDVLDSMFTKVTGMYAKDILAQVEICDDVAQNTKDTNQKNYSSEEIQFLLNKKDEFEKQEISSEIEVKIQSMLRMFERHNLYGNEAMLTFMAYDSKLKYFGQCTRKSIVWRKSPDGTSKNRELFIKNQESQDIYAINFEELCAEPLTIEMVKKLIEQGNMIYEDNEHRMER